MSKRLFRISPLKLVESIQDISDRQISIVLKNRTTFVGKIINIKSNNVTFELIFGKKIEFTLNSISEIIYDKLSS